MIALALAALAAGWVDAVVGGGGLIQLPAAADLLPAAAPTQMLATNKLSSICGTGVSAVTYAGGSGPSCARPCRWRAGARRRCRGCADCASCLPNAVFRPVVLWPS